MCKTLIDDDHKSRTTATQKLGTDDINPFISYHMWLCDQACEN